jgi:hypothetical protein
LCADPSKNLDHITAPSISLKLVDAMHILSPFQNKREEDKNMWLVRPKKRFMEKNLMGIYIAITIYEL